MKKTQKNHETYPETDQQLIKQLKLWHDSAWTAREMKDELTARNLWKSLTITKIKTHLK